MKSQEIVIDLRILEWNKYTKWLFEIDLETGWTPLTWLFHQLFGVMPLRGLSSKNLSKVNFSWSSKRLIGSFAFLLVDLAMIILFALYFSDIGFTAKNMVSIVFFGASFAAYLLFLLLATRWPKIIRYWSRREEKFLKPNYAIKKLQMGRKVKVVSIGIALLALGEHIMYQVSTIYSFHKKMVLCNITVNDQVESYYRKQYPWVYEILPYHHLISIVVQRLSLASTFVWNFMDLFIILVSMGLTARFKQLHSRLQFELDTAGNQAQDFFREIRLDFITLLDLLNYVDKELSFIILLSCLNNLYFICYQLMNIFDALRYFINYAYFWYSLLYLIGRTAFLFIAAASINEAARMPAQVLKNVPSHIWCEEADRFLHQVYSETIGLTAMGFFHFTRELVVTMAGTIITYEMVIIQFDRSSVDYELPPLCD